MILESILMIAASCAAGGVTDEPDPGENVVRVYDVAAITATRLGGSVGQGLLPYLGPGPAIDEEAPEAPFDVDRVMEILNETFPEEMEYEGRAMWSDGRDRILIRGPESLQLRMREVLAFLERSLTSRVELTVDVVTFAQESADTGAPSGFVSLREAEALRAGSQRGARVQTHRLDLIPGRAARVDLTREHTIVLDYDLEIAQGAFIHDPIVGTLSVGTNLTVRAHPMPGGGLGLALTIRRGEALGDVTQHFVRHRGMVGDESGHDFVDAPRSLQKLDVLSRSITCNTLLPDEKALVFRSRTDLSGAQGTELVIVRRTGGSLSAFHHLGEGPDSGKLVLIDSEAVAPPHARVIGPLLDEYSGDAEERNLDRMWWWRGSYPQLASVVRSGDVDMVAEMLDRSNTGFYLNMAGPWLVGIRSADLLQEIADAGAALNDVAAVVATYSQRAVPLEIGLRLRRSGRSPSEAVSCVLPVRAGEDCATVIGVERLIEWDYDVEVAQFASAADLQVRLAFDGLALKLRPSVGPSGDLVLDVRGEAHLLSSQRRLELDGPHSETLDQGSYDRLVLDDRLVAPAGEGSRTFVLGDASERGGEGSLTLEVTVRR